MGKVVYECIDPQVVYFPGWSRIDSVVPGKRLDNGILSPTLPHRACPSALRLVAGYVYRGKIHELPTSKLAGGTIAH